MILRDSPPRTLNLCGIGSGFSTSIMGIMSVLSVAKVILQLWILKIAT